MHDSQAVISWLVRQNTRIQSNVIMQPLPEIQYRGLIPVDTTGPQWLKTVGMYSGNQYGKAKWINGNSDDIPLVDIGRNFHQSQVYTAGVGYGYGLEEIECALEAGQDLRPDKAAAARRASEEMIDDVVFNGDQLKGFSGFLSMPLVTVQAPIFGDWLGATPPTEDQVLRDLNSLISGSGQATNFTSYANTILLPELWYDFIASARLGDDGSETILSFLERRNVYTARTGQQLMIRSMRGLDTAAVSGGARAVAYRNSAESLVLRMPMSYRFFPVYQEDVLNFVVPGLFRLGGLEVLRPEDIRYMDDI